MKNVNAIIIFELEELCDETLENILLSNENLDLASALKLLEKNLIQKNRPKNNFDYLNLNISLLITLLRCHKIEQSSGSIKNALSALVDKFQRCLGSWPNQNDLTLFFNLLKLCDAPLSLKKKFCAIFMGEFQKLYPLINAIDPFALFVIQVKNLPALDDSKGWRGEERNQFIANALQRIENIKNFDSIVMEELIDIAYALKNDEYPSEVLLISIKLIKWLTGLIERSNLGHFTYRIAWYILFLSASQKAKPEIILQKIYQERMEGIFFKIIKDLNFIFQNKHKIPSQLFRLLFWLILEIKPEIRMREYHIQLITNYIKISDVKSSIKLISELTSAKRFLEIDAVFRQIPYDSRVRELLTKMPIDCWKKLISTNNPFSSTFLYLLFFSKENLPCMNDEKMRVLVPKEFSHFMNVHWKQIFLSAQNLLIWRSGVFFIGSYFPDIRLDLCQDIQTIILQYCFSFNFKELPGKMFLDYLKTRKRIRSTSLWNASACAVHYFAINYPKPLDSASFDRICNLLCVHLAKTFTYEILIVNRALRELIYAAIKDLAVKRIYLTDCRVKSLVEDSVKKYSNIQSAMFILAMGITDCLYKKIGLKPLDLSTCQLAIGLELMWVKYFKHLPLTFPGQLSGAMAYQIARSIIKLSQDSVFPDQKDSFVFKFPINTTLYAESFRSVKLNSSCLSTIFSESRYKIQKREWVQLSFKTTTSPTYPLTIFRKRKKIEKFRRKNEHLEKSVRMMEEAQAATAVVAV